MGLVLAPFVELQPRFNPALRTMENDPKEQKLRSSETTCSLDGFEGSQLGFRSCTWAELPEIVFKNVLESFLTQFYLRDTI